jgi:hypothetical protein
MTNDLLRHDEDKTYQCDAEKVMKIIDTRALIPEDLKHKKEELY